ncbi:MAG: ATP synthase F1 subunit epsilon [Hyphomicrobiaceae bacterium]|nr:ATP synthase F1 subunit epsilon [Hyphomicrobiaceae bacterium]
MAGTFKFELVSPERVLLSGDASEAIVPGMDGQFTVLAGHAPVISTLRPGTLVVKMGTSERRVFVRGGIAEVEPESLTILAQHLIDLEGEDRASEVASALRTAEDLVASSKDDLERMTAADAVDQLRALSSR